MTANWPGAAAIHQVPFRRVFTRLNRPVPADASIVTAFTDGQVTLRSNRSKVGYHEAADLSGFQGVEAGDFVVHGLDIMRGSVGVSESRGAISAVCIVCTPSARVDPRYIAYAIRLQATSGYPKALARGIREGGADFRRWTTLAELPVPIPPVSVQRAIADYLDRETARIDTLIAKQEHLITTLRERRDSLRERWFIDHTANTRLARALHAVVDCVHTTPDLDEDGKYEAIRTSNVRDGKFRPRGTIRVSHETWLARNQGGEPASGDILLSREAPAGEACMVPDDRQVCLGQRMVLLRTNHELALGEFLLAQLYTKRVQDHFSLSGSGSTVSNLRLGVIRSTPVWLPDLSSQQLIASEIMRGQAKIDTLITKAERFIKLSKERRAALITAAVTGQLEIPSET